MQGEVMAPLECSVSVDTFGKECQEEEKHLYYYRDIIGVPSLSMVDDEVNISKCGLESVALNAYMNAKSNTKKFQFGKDKCHKLHIGCNKESCPDLYLDTWKISASDEYDTGNNILHDEVDEEYKIEHSDEERYLGDLITSNGKNTNNMTARKAKGVGIVEKITSILNDVFFGPYFYQAALNLRMSLLLSSILLNSESWYNMTENDLKQLESVDNMLHRRILESPLSTPISILHLELGTLPIRYLIKCRRLLFLQYILKENKDSLLYKFFEAQSKHPQKGDWVLQINEDLKEVELNLTFSEIKCMSVFSFNTRVRKAIMKSAFKYLIAQKNRPGSKGSIIKYDELKIRSYFLPNTMTIKQCNLLFSLRARMVSVRCNYKNSYNDLTCQNCQDQSQLDTHIHLLSCKENLVVKTILQ